MVFLKFLSVIEELLIIQDQSRAGLGVYGNSRVLKCYRDWLNLGDSDEAAEKNCQTFFASKGKNVLRNSLQIASSRVIRLIKGRSYV